MLTTHPIKAGATSQIVEFDVLDSSSTTGARLAGLVYNTSGLTAYYSRQNATGAWTAISLATMTKGTWVSGGFVASDATNAPGSYQLGLPDAAVASSSGVNFVTVYLKGAANMVPVVLQVPLDHSIDQTGDTYAIANDGTNGLVAAVTARANIKTDTANIYTDTHTTILGRLIGTIATGTHQPQTGDSFAVVKSGGAGDNAAIKAKTDTIVAGLDADGTRTALGLATANLDTQLSGINSKTTNLPASPAAVGSNMGTVTNITGTVPAVALAASQPNYAPAKAGDSMALTTGERATLTAAIEAALISEADGQQLLAAIVSAINAADVNLAGLSTATIASAVANMLLVTPANKIATDGSGQVTAANMIAAAPDVSTIASAVRTNLATELGRIDAAVSTRLATTGYTAPPSIDDLPTNAELGLAILGLSQVQAAPDISGLATKLEVLALSPVLPAAPIDMTPVVEAIDAIPTPTFSGTVSAPAVTVNPTVLSSGERAAIAAVTAAQITADHGIGAYGGETFGDVVTITPDTLGTDGSKLGRVMPYGRVTVYHGNEAAYQFDADADGDYSYDLPVGSIWTLVARKSGYQDTEAEVSTE